MTPGMEEDSPHAPSIIIFKLHTTSLESLALPHIHQHILQHPAHILRDPDPIPLPPRLPDLVHQRGVDLLQLLDAAAAGARDHVLE